MTDKKYIPGGGPFGAKLMIVAPNPTLADVQMGKSLMGPVGKQLDYILDDAGIRRSDCWLTTVSKYEIPGNFGEKKKIPFHVRAKNAGIDIDKMVRELQEEINTIKPNCILALGEGSLWALSGKNNISQFRGSILWGMGTKFVPTYNPSGLLFNSADKGEFKGYWNRQVMIADCRRALAQSKFSDYQPPSRTLEICKSSWQLAEFLKKYKDRRKMAADIEANGTCIPVCVGLAFNKHHGMTVPLWNHDGISTIPDADLVQCWILLAQALYEKDIIGQNFNYDRDKLKRLGFIIRRLYDDIMLKAHAIHPELPKGLAFNTSLFTEEPFYKDEGMYHGHISDLLIGCARDSCVTYEVNDAMDADLTSLGMRSFYRNFLMELPNLYWSIERQGFAVNTVERDALLHKYIEWDERLRYELFKLVGTEINVNSPKQVAVLLYENFKLPNKGGTGEEIITDLLNTESHWKKRDQSHRRVCELILEGRRVRKSISTYLMALPDYDGRMRTTYFPCLDTGRSSSGQQDPPIRPEVEVIDENGKKKDKVLGIAFQTMTKHGDIGADIRGQYVPDSYHLEYDEERHLKIVFEEEIFVQADSSQAEARVVALLADDEATLKMYDENDVHALTASWFFGGSESDYSKKVLGYEHPIRFAGKTLRHAGHLGAGKLRAAAELNTQARKYKIPITITAADADRALQIFHRKSPRIQQVFQNQVIETLKRSRTLVAALPYGVDAAMGGKRTFFERMGEELYRQGLSYLPQRAVSDNTKNAALRIKQRIPLIKIVMEAHDALLFSVPKSKLPIYLPIIKEEMERPIDFSRCSLPRHELIIPCDIETGSNYRDLKKFKDAVIILPPTQKLAVREKSITEQFQVAELPPDSHLDEKIYDDQRRRFNLDD